MTWVILTNRIGSDTKSPKKDQVVEAIEDLWRNRRDTEHSSICLRHGNDDETMEVVELFSDGSLTYSEYFDQDFEELKREFRFESIGVQDATRRFMCALTGDTYSMELCQWNRKWEKK